MNNHEVSAQIKKLLEKSEDFHNVFTPFELCEEVLGKVHQNFNPKEDSKYLVIANLEFVWTLKKYLESCKIGMNNVWFATPCEYREKAAKSMGVMNVVKYTYKDILKGFKDMPKFDVVLGNPPYQDSSATSTSNSSLWVDFSRLAFSLLKQDGIVGFVTPQSWMKPNHKILKWLKEKELLHVSTTIGKHFPGVGSTFSYWIAKNTGSKTNHTALVDGEEVQIKNVPYLVSGPLMFSIHKKLVFNTPNKFKVDSDQQTAYTLKLTKGSKDLSKERSAHCKYPIFHTNAQTIYSAIKTKNFDDKKVMFSDSGYFKPRYDNGQLGSSQRCYYILVKDNSEGTNLAEILNRKVYQFIVSTAKWSGFSDLTVLRSLPAVDLSRSWTDEELYAYFNLTSEEIKLIEEQQNDN